MTLSLTHSTTFSSVDSLDALFLGHCEHGAFSGKITWSFSEDYFIMVRCHLKK